MNKFCKKTTTKIEKVKLILYRIFISPNLMFSTLKTSSFQICHQVSTLAPPSCFRPQFNGSTLYFTSKQILYIEVCFCHKNINLHSNVFSRLSAILSTYSACPGISDVRFLLYIILHIKSDKHVCHFKKIVHEITY